HSRLFLSITAAMIGSRGIPNAKNSYVGEFLSEGLSHIHLIRRRALRDSTRCARFYILESKRCGQSGAVMKAAFISSGYFVVFLVPPGYNSIHRSGIQ